MSNKWKEKLGEDLLNCEVKAYCYANVDEADADVIFSECLYKVFKIEDAKLKDIYDRGKHIDYFFLVVRNTIYNYYRAKRIEWVDYKPEFDILDEDYVEEGAEIIEAIDEWANEWGSMWWYHAGLLKLYAEEGSIAGVNRRTKIPKSSIAHSIKEFREWIIEICNELGLNE